MVYVLCIIGSTLLLVSLNLAIVVENSKKSADVLYGRPLTLTLKQGINSLGKVSAGASRINS